MFEQIHASLEALFIDKYPIFMNEDNWSELIDIYQQCKSPDDLGFFILELEEWTSIPGDELQALFHPLESKKIEAQTIEDGRKIFNQKATEIVKSANTFKHRALAAYPTLSILGLSDFQWLKIDKLYQALNRKTVGSKLLILAISQILDKDYDDLIKQLSSKQPARQAKSFFRDSQPASSHHTNRHRSKPLADLTRSSYVINGNAVPPALAATGVKAKLLAPATPGRNGYREPFRSPGKSIYHGIVTHNGTTLFDKATPIKSQAQVNDHHSPTNPAIKRYKQVKEIRFTVTKEKLEACSNKKRIVGQKALTGISCRDVFIEYGDDSAEELSGNDFHWGHVIAYYLGGQQSSANLAPGTAISNYNTLKIVERFADKKLNSGACSSIDVIATPYYHGHCKIPYDIVFQLKWKEPARGNSEQLETISINPRSHKKIEAGNLRSIQALRDYNPEADVENDPENQSYGPKKLF